VTTLNPDQSATSSSRPALTRGQIVAAATALVDGEGLDKLTLRHLATQLGVTPMALYWHFRDKEALLDALGDALYAAIHLPEPVEPWPVDLSRVVQAVIDAFAEHPALAPLALTSALSSSSGLLLAERILALLTSAGLDDETAANAGAILLHHVVSLVAAIPTADENLRTNPELLSGRYPTTLRLAPHLIECNDLDAFLHLGRDLLVSGVRSLVASATT